MAETPNLFPKHSLVACQGVEGAYSQQACDKFFPAANILYFRTFEGVFQAVEQGLCPYGVLPIENSTHGTVDEVYDLMQRYACYIVRSIKLKIDHVLLTPPGVSLEDVREVFSHEQAIGQCSEFLKAHPNIKVTVCENTAAAAKMVAASGRKDCASISSRCCASLYGLHAAAENIQNSDGNYTRFLCISRKLEIYPGANRISLMMALDECKEGQEDEEAVMEAVRAGMQALLESQTETRRQDKKMVERVSELDETIKGMSEELGRKVSVEEVADRLGITEAEIEDILKLAGEEVKDQE